MEEIRLSHKAAEPVSESSDDEPTSVQVKRPGLPQRPELPIEDTVLGPANIGIKSIRPVAVGQMPENLAPFTMLLEVRSYLICCNVFILFHFQRLFAE